VLGVGRGGPLGVAAEVARAPDRAPVPGAEPSAGHGPAASRAQGGASRRPAAAARLGEREAWIALAAVDGLGPVTFGGLLRAFGSARDAVEIAARRGGAGRLVRAMGGEGLRLDPGVAAAIAAAGARAPALLARLDALGVVAVTAEEAAYPARLRGIELPPPVLFVRGDVAAAGAERSVAVVGTRRPTDDGRRAASRIAGAMAAAGATVVSGLALGIDGSAHAGALLGGGITVAVLGSGHAHLYPAVHADLAREIERTGGAVVSELPPDAAPRPAGFPRRNRIIAGLADATVVVEAGERSGALITASWALEQGRAVFACPGPIDRPQAIGCNRLIHDHPGEVGIVPGTDELIADLGYGIPLAVRRRRAGRAEAPAPDPGAIVARLGAAEKAVVRRLLEGAATADALAVAADLPGATVLAVLTRLEEEGLVVATFGRYRLAGSLAGVRAGGPRRGSAPPGPVAPAPGSDP
jgi:DNA processing protein